MSSLTMPLSDFFICVVYVAGGACALFFLALAILGRRKP
jgi:hypothetical protein